MRVERAWQQILARRDYPVPLQRVLGEMVAASALMASMLKFDGALVLQLQGSGPLSLAIVEYYTDHTLRATARWDGQISECSLPELLGEDGCFVLTLDPKREGAPPWQGIVALEGACVSSILEKYMLHSEQLDTKLVLTANEKAAAGLLLQRLPDGQGDPEGWTRLALLGKTVSDQELLTLDATQLLRRLFYEETVQVLSCEPINFACTCTRERVSDMLRMVGVQEIAEILWEQGSVEITCEFCAQRYVFDEEEVNELFQFDVMTNANESRH